MLLGGITTNVLLGKTSLFSIKVLTDCGRNVIYDMNECQVYFKNEIVWVSKKEPTTGLWVLPVNSTEGKLMPTQKNCDMFIFNDSTQQHMVVNS